MAKDESPDVAPETTEAKKSITKPQMIGIAVVAAALLWSMIGKSPEDPSATGGEQVDGAPKVKLDIDKAIDAEGKDAEGELKDLEGGLVEGIELDNDVNSQAAVAILTKRLESQRSMIEDLTERMNKTQSDLKETLEQQNQAVQAQISQVKDLVLESDYADATKPRDDGAPLPSVAPGQDGDPAAGDGSSGISFGDNPFSLGGSDKPAPSKSSSPAVVKDDGRYMVLSGNLSRGQQSATPAKSGLFDGKLTNPFAEEPPTEIKLGGQTVDLKEERKPITDGAMMKPEDDKDDGNYLIIPAFSYVDTTLLHAVSCPVGGSLVGASSSIPPRPIVLPVRGIFKGPNGAAYDVGHVHFFGVCSARYDLNGYGRAEITIQKLSYWLNDKEKTPIEIDATGYIVDSSDNEIDVKGPIKSLEKKYLLAETLGQGISAYAGALKQQEFTNTVSADGNVTSALTGSAVAAAGANSVSAMMTTWSDFMRRKAQAVVDTVYVNGGHRVKVITTQRLKIRLPAPPVDEKVWKRYEDLYL